MSMKYAVVKLQGKQFRVEEGQELTVDRLPQEEKASLVLPEVLMVVDGDNVSVGTPTVSSAQVKTTVLSHTKAEKIRVATYKAKSRFRKVRGHRQSETTLRIDAISAK
ncbi:MAG TPA: 50S ribosomal protein L21 [Patescibacteria group bacterium]|nr:50S ribosomal protein L21 [Patescibacteria group bacterium]